MTKPKSVSVKDNYGSVPQLRAAVKEVLWSMVDIVQKEAILAEEALEEQERIQMQVSLEEEMGVLAAFLPLQFISASGQKRKRGSTELTTNAPTEDAQTGKNNNKAKPSIASKKGLIVEENILKYFEVHGSENYTLVKVLGVSPQSLPAGSKAVIRILSSMTTLHADRATQLRPLLTKSERKAAKRSVVEDEAFCLRHGAPAEVHLKYWNQRYRLLSKFDQGILLDAESWYSITPESIARYLTKRCMNMARSKGFEIRSVIDCFSGCGGNTIPFAAAGIFVLSLDNDLVKLQYLR